MNCNNCGKPLFKNESTCSDCGNEILVGEHSKNRTDHAQEDRVKGSVVLNSIRNSERNITEEKVLIKEEVITVREREKRIIQEKIKSQIDSAREERRRDELNKKNIIEAMPGLKNVENENIFDSNNAEIPLNLLRVVPAEEEKTIPPAQKANQKTKTSKRRNRFFSLIYYLTGIAVFIVVMLYLFLRFAPATDVNKNMVVSWMNTNLNKKTNDFIFIRMELGQYYTPPKVVDYSGIYHDKTNMSVKLVLTHKSTNLSGSYFLNGKEFILTGFDDNKGDFLLLESIDNVPTAIWKGTLFANGYLTAERYEQLSGQKAIYSLEKDLSN